MKQTFPVKLAKWILKRTVLGDGTIRTIFRGPCKGLRYRIFPGFGLAPLYGGWENEAQNLMVRYLRPGMTAYDIGANYGMHSLLMARRVTGEGRVYAFEPVPHIQAHLRENISLNAFSNVEVVEAAISDKNGEAVFFRGIHEGAGHLKVFSEDSDSIRVKTTTLDSFVFDRNAQPPDFIKMDVEGEEGRVLAGAERVLAEFRPICLIDLHNPEQDLAVGRLLKKYGYTVYRTDGEYVRDLTKSWPSADGIWGQIIAVSSPFHVQRSLRFFDPFLRSLLRMVRFLMLLPARAGIVLRRKALREAQERPRLPRCMISKAKVLVVSQFNYGSTSWSRKKAISKLALETHAIDTAPFLYEKSWINYFLINHLYAGPVVNEINCLAIQESKELKPEFVWVDRGLQLFPKTLKKMKSLSGCLIHFSPDNQCFEGNQSRHYLRSIPIYDIHVTTKPRDMQWLRDHGAPRVESMENGIDPDLHRPILLNERDTKKFGCDIGFVGHWEPSREETLLFLRHHFQEIKVWGGGWERSRSRVPLFWDCPHLVGDDYVKAICGAKINLCLLSQWFDDQTTTRSVEIPACGKFMLAERNPEHQAMYKEGTEAEFYASGEELLDKIHYYLKHEAEREKIALAGRKKCLQFYSNEKLLTDLFLRIAGNA